MKIAVIDDEKDDRFFLSRILLKYDVEVQTYTSSIDFGAHANADDFDFVWIDFTINHGAGAKNILRALTVKSKTRVVFISHGDKHFTKEFRENPIVWGLLLKGDTDSIHEHIKNRLYERAHPEIYQ